MTPANDACEPRTKPRRQRVVAAQLILWAIPVWQCVLSVQCVYTPTHQVMEPEVHPNESVSVSVAHPSVKLALGAGSPMLLCVHRMMRIPTYSVVCAHDRELRRRWGRLGRGAERRGVGKGHTRWDARDGDCVAHEHGRGCNALEPTPSWAGCVALLDIGESLAAARSLAAGTACCSRCYALVGGAALIDVVAV